MFRGLTAGLQLIAEFAVLFILAVNDRDIPLLVQLAEVMNQWLKDGEYVAAKITISPIKVLTGDPFRKSREALRKVKVGIHAAMPTNVPEVDKEA